jgi:hypothetical protein
LQVLCRLFGPTIRIVGVVGSDALSLSVCLYTCTTVLLTGFVVLFGKELCSGEPPGGAELLFRGGYEIWKAGWIGASPRFESMIVGDLSFRWSMA